MIESIIASWMSPDLAQRLAGSLLHFVWQGAIIAMVAAIVLRLLANRSAEWRYTVSVAALLLMVAAPVVTFIFYTQTGQATLTLLQFIGEGVKASAQAGQAAATASWTQWIVLAWLIGVLICSIRLIAGWRMSRSLTNVGTSVVPTEIQKSFNEIRDRLAMTTAVRLLASLRIDTPVAVGWLRPVVLLPITAITGLNAAQLRAVFAHELAHIRRHDFLVNLVQRVVESILFYHAAVWWLSSRIRSEREHCCDDLAMQISGDHVAYAQALFELERVRTVEPELAVAAAGGNLTQRIHRVLGYRIVNYDWQSAAAALLFVVVWVMVGAWQSDSTLDASSQTPRPVAAPIVMQSPTVPAPRNLSGAMNAIAAIVTAQPVEPLRTAQATAVGNGVIEGVLRDDSGKPAASVPVFVGIARTDTAVSTSGASTDNDGRYRFEGIPPGQYTILAGRAAFPTYYPGTLDAGGSRVVTVAPGATVSNINFAMEPMSVGVFRTTPPPAPLSPVSNATSTFSTEGTLTLFVSIQVEGGGKVPIFANGRFPKLKLTKIDTNTAYEMWFAGITIGVPRNITTKPDEYKVAVVDLPDGYAVKSITYRADEPGVRFEDVRNQTLKISLRAINQTTGGTISSAGASDLPIAITLTRTPVAAPSGVRVTGTSEGMFVNRQLPNVGGDLPNIVRVALSDAGVYISGKPGILYDDGTFEFAGVSPGLHSIILIRSGSPGPPMTAAQITVRDRDVEGVTLQNVTVLPRDILFRQAPQAAMPAVSSLSGRVLDEGTQQPIAFGYVTLSGYAGSTRQFVGFGKETFIIPNLIPGQYSLTAEANGYKSKTQQITVGPQAPPLDIKLTR